jgi:hypothetical protein
VSFRQPIVRTNHLIDSGTSFAFVEYESRRDADDAYHEMHNKRIGRDDLLKIEVCERQSSEIYINQSDIVPVGQNSPISLVEVRYWS